MSMRKMTRQKDGLLLAFRCADGGEHPLLLRIRTLSGGVIRVTRTRNAAFLDRPSDVVVHADARECVVTETAEAFCVTGDSVTATVDRRTGSLTFALSDGSVLLREDPKHPCDMTAKPLYRSCFSEETEIVETRTVDGARASATASDVRFDRTVWACRHNLRFDADEGLYGLGSHEEGFGNLRGHARQLYQHNLKAVVPVLVSTAGWGLLYDAGCQMAFHDDEEGSFVWLADVDELDFYFIGGGSYAAVMAAYAGLTGSTPMLPRYAFGYAQSKERYHDAEEMLAVARAYRRRQVPLDTLVLDWQSWPDGQWGWKTFDRARFPEPKVFLDALHALHIRLMISIWPSMQGADNQDRREMLEAGLMLGNRSVYNAFDERARRLYWQQAEKGLFRYGVDAWWCDCTEPFEADWHGETEPEPAERARLNTDEARKYLDPTQINLYSLLHAKGIYAGQRTSGSPKRVYNLTRSSYAGQHRYATVTWSGDVSASWETLRRHIPEGLHFCATGEAYWSADIGGFFVKPGKEWFRKGDFPQGVEDLGYRELYVRWLQYAAFLPIMRSHGTDAPREIWRFGERGEPFYDAIEAAIRLRYTLLPYLYALAAECTACGMPMLRVPALIFPKDVHTRQVDDEMLLGPFLLVKPVARPMLYGPGSVPLHADSTEAVYLPACAGWYALDTEDFFEGGQTIRFEAPLNRIPVFVRAGAILPRMSEVQHTEERPDHLSLTVYPGTDGAFTLYDDAGDGYGYERGESVRIPLVWEDAKRRLTIGVRQGSYPGMPEQLRLRVRRVGGPSVDLLYTGEARQIMLL